jgi:hypothetical protein
MQPHVVRGNGVNVATSVSNAAAIRVPFAF